MGKMNLSTFMSTFSIIPLGYWIDLSASSKLILVALGSPNPNLSYIIYGIKLIVALSDRTSFFESGLIGFLKPFSVEPLLFLFAIFREMELEMFVSRLMEFVGFLGLIIGENGYAVLDRKLNTPYPMEMDTPYQAQIRRIFLDGYGVFVFRTVIFIFLLLGSRMRYGSSTRITVVVKICPEGTTMVDVALEEGGTIFLPITTAQLQLLSDYYCWKEYAGRDEIKD
ncbi:hypothetical protein Tco_0540346 [Tanacetum coccineum]